MAANFDWGIRGDLFKMLADFPKKVERKSVSDALRKGADIVRRAAIANARRIDNPATPQQIFSKIIVRSDVRHGKKLYGGFLVKVGVAGGFKKYTDSQRNRRYRRVGKKYFDSGDVYYWRFIELGTKKMRARPFLRPALAQNIDTSSSAVAKYLESAIAKLAGGASE